MDKMMGGEQLTDTDRDNMKRYDIRLRERANRPQQDSGCPDGKNCPTYKEVAESELLDCLNEGWAITHNLQNGSVIVQREI